MQSSKPVEPVNGEMYGIRPPLTALPFIVIAAVACVVVTIKMIGYVVLFSNYTHGAKE